jgi:hypothetical protein
VAKHCLLWAAAFVARVGTSTVAREMGRLGPTVNKCRSFVSAPQRAAPSLMACRAAMAAVDLPALVVFDGMATSRTLTPQRP